jgi:hypothetical protein
MGKIRRFAMFGVMLAFALVGFFVGRSPAQPDDVRRNDLPLFVKIGDWRFNPRQITYVNTVDIGAGQLAVFFGPQHGKDFKLGTDGEAEALVEWFDAHSTVLKPKPVKKK